MVVVYCMDMSKSTIQKEKEVTTKIEKLTIEDFCRITFAEINLQGDIQEFIGKNRQGKSTVLNAIASVTGGKLMHPPAPIRKGQKKGSVGIDFTDGTKAKATWRRDSDDGRIRYNLVIKTSDGLDAGVGWLQKRMASNCLDPDAIHRQKPKERRETLLKIFGVDLDELERRHDEAYTLRRDANRDLKNAKTRLEAMPEPDPGVPSVEVSSAALMDEYKAALAVQGQEDSLKDSVSSCESRMDSCKDEMSTLRKRMEMLKEKLSADRKTLGSIAVPDVSEIKARMDAAEETNRAIRSANRWRELSARVAEYQEPVNFYQQELDTIAGEKIKSLSSIDTGIHGLVVTDNDIELNGLPFDSASTAETIRACIAISMAEKPELAEREIKFALVYGGNDIHDEYREEFYQALRDEGVQGIIERRYATTDAAIEIVDGGVAE